MCYLLNQPNHFELVTTQFFLYVLVVKCVFFLFVTYTFYRVMQILCEWIFDCSNSSDGGSWSSVNYVWTLRDTSDTDYQTFSTALVLKSFLFGVMHMPWSSDLFMFYVRSFCNSKDSFKKAQITLQHPTRNDVTKLVR